MGPISSSANRAAAVRASGNTKDVVWWIGRAREPGRQRLQLRPQGRQLGGLRVGAEQGDVLAHRVFQFLDGRIASMHVNEARIAATEVEW